jgi:hypothetical protein
MACFFTRKPRRKRASSSARPSAGRPTKAIDEVDLDTTGTAWFGDPASMRWVLIHMIEDTVPHTPVIWISSESSSTERRAITLRTEPVTNGGTGRRDGPRGRSRPARQLVAGSRPAWPRRIARELPPHPNRQPECPGEASSAARRVVQATREADSRPRIGTTNRFRHRGPSSGPSLARSTLPASPEASRRSRRVHAHLGSPRPPLRSRTGESVTRHHPIYRRRRGAIGRLSY